MVPIADMKLHLKRRNQSPSISDWAGFRTQLSLIFFPPLPPWTRGPRGRTLGDGPGLGVGNSQLLS